MSSQPDLLKPRAAELECFVKDHSIDPWGVIYTAFESGTLGPWTDENWNLEDDFLPVKGFAAREVLQYENSGMTTGGYLAAQTYRWWMPMILSTGSGATGRDVPKGP